MPSIIARPDRRPVGHRHGGGQVELDDGRRASAAGARRRGRRSAASRCPPAVGASSCRAAIAAWSWYGPGRRSSSVACHERLALGDPRGVPARSVLVVEQDQLAGRADPRLAAGVVQQHQRQQAGRLGLVGEQRDHEPCQPDRLGAQLAPDQRVAGRRGVALVEHEVEDRAARRRAVRAAARRAARGRGSRRRGSCAWRGRGAGRGSAPGPGTPGRSPAWSGRRACAASARPARPSRAPGGSR